MGFSRKDAELAAQALNFSTVLAADPAVYNEVAATATAVTAAVTAFVNAFNELTEARANGAVRALTLPADAPLVTASELSVLLEAGGRPSPLRRGVGGGGPQEAPLQLTLVPSYDRDGTNAILVSPPDTFAPSFGPGSFARHQSLARKRGAACRTLQLPGLAMDVDEPGDLLRLMQAKRGDPRYTFLDTHCMNLLEATDQA